jgi:uncharacterized repeat protein (TIGR03803 family)
MKERPGTYGQIHEMLHKYEATCAILLFCALTTICSSAQTFTVLHTFSLADGAFPFGTLVQGLDGNFYGTTAQGNGQNQCSGGCGTVFKITPDGTLTTLHSFDKTDGAYPVAGLVLGTDGNFYGSTYGADSPQSTSDDLPALIFKITPDGALTNLPAENYILSSAYNLMQNVIDGAFYGTSSGPEELNENGYLFSEPQAGDGYKIHTFCSNGSGGINNGHGCSDDSQRLAVEQCAVSSVLILRPCRKLRMPLA